MKILLCILMISTIPMFAQTSDIRLDFEGEKFAEGDVIGQDGWDAQIEWLHPVIKKDASGNKFLYGVNTDDEKPKIVMTRHAVPLSLKGTETVVIQFDTLTPVHDFANMQAGLSAVNKMGPMVGFWAGKIWVRKDNWGSLTNTKPIERKTDTWYTVHMEWNLTANGGQGSVSVKLKEKDGTDVVPIVFMDGKSESSLGITSDVKKWDCINFRFSQSNGPISAIDNIVVKVK